MSANKVTRSDAHGDGGFDFSRRMWDLCQDAAVRLGDLGHVDMARVAVSFSQTRSRVLHGLQAKLTPLRFQGGSLQQRRSGRLWTVERLYDASGHEMLYILSFYLPRFMEQPPQEKLTTIFHELWHISPTFDGDLRRFPGRCYAHSPRQKHFDEHAAWLARQWLDQQPPPHLYEFLGYSFNELVRRYGRVYGLKIRVPKLIPL